ERLRACGVELLPCAARDGRVDLPDMLARLGALGIDSLLLEGGEALNGSFVAQGLVDEYYFFIAPKILGGQDAKTAVGGPGFAKMADAQALDIRSVEQIGPDLLVHAYPKK
ncbi:MAG: dihydrofolate reductase family protein, partial [Bacteroidales bacterium]|nr:dihydrofolate reductase family protein [Bacteroidales bacterium]